MSIDDQREENLKAYSRGQYSQAFSNRTQQQRINMYERTHKIKELIDNGIVEIDVLARSLNVSKNTIMKDLRKHGGHTKNGKAVI